ncbi:MAG: hypothetical protein R3344_11420 [Acidobacteriota bacterium]|nr:hypothetical protein [Acidobacteriota bacterium]
MQTTTAIRSTPDAGNDVGLWLADDTDPEDLPCDQVEDLDALENVASQLRSEKSADPPAVDSVGDILDALRRRDAPMETGLAAVPPARHVLRVLRELNEARLPADLPSEFSLTVVAAPDDYAEALALERMLVAEDPDEEFALGWLGDHATAAAVPLLRMKLRTSTSGDRARIVSMTLRALLAADPRIARLVAVPLLSHPSFARAALGVFAVTDPYIREDLESLDPADGDAVQQAGLRILAGLQATAPEEEVREAATAERRAGNLR